MATLFYPANLQWVGLAKEVTYGVPIAAPTIWVPVDTPVWTPHPQLMTDQALRGFMGMDYQQQLGLRYDDVTYKTYFYLDSVYQHFLALLGNPDTVTGSADPWTHKTALYNGSGSNSAQPPSFTVFYTDAAGKTWQMPGSVPSDVKVTLTSSGLATLDVAWTGLPSVAITPPTNTPTVNKPMPSWNSTITVGGTVLSKYSQIVMDYKRATEMIPTITGTQTPFAIFGGPVTATFDLTGVYQNSTDTDLANFLANTQPVLLVKTAPPGDALHGLTMQHSQIAYDDASPSGTNKWMEIKAKGKCLMNTTDALGGGESPAQAIFTSAQSTAY